MPQVVDPHRKQVDAEAVEHLAQQSHGTAVHDVGDHRVLARVEKRQHDRAQLQVHAVIFSATQIGLADTIENADKARFRAFFPSAGNNGFESVSAAAVEGTTKQNSLCFIRLVIYPSR